MSNAQIDEVQILHPAEIIINIGEDIYPIRKFCLSKTLRIFSLLSELLKDPEINRLFTVEPDRWTLALIQMLPHLLDTAKPLIMRIVALALTSNVRLREIDEQELSLDAELDKVTKDLSYNEELTIEKLLEIVSVSIERMGLDAIRKNLPMLQQQIQNRLEI